MTKRDVGFRLAYTTPHGRAYQGDSTKLLTSSEVPEGSVDLLMMSPPFALTRKKDYGNQEETEYVRWFADNFVKPFDRVLSDAGSLVIDIGGAYVKGSPRRSTYHFKLAAELAGSFDFCQEFYWYNPAKLPSPAEWVNVRRIRVKDSVNLVLWFAKDAGKTKADNRRVLTEYSASMKTLLEKGYLYRTRPSGHDISEKFLRDNGGAIPPNLLSFPNTASNDRYQRACKEHGVKPHPARFPIQLPSFFIKFLTEPGDTVLDPFAGSNVTGEAAEALGRRWISCDLDREGDRIDTYVRASAFRFADARLEPDFNYVPEDDWQKPSKLAKRGDEVASVERSA
jgi:site-specific DNA-methyltransferase (cytosine-N4-specific)